MSEPRVAGIALDAAVLGTLATGLLFVAGWGYAETWFAQFDLGVVGLGIPTGNFAIYGWWAMGAHAGWLLLLAALGAFWPLARFWVRKGIEGLGPPWLPGGTAAFATVLRRVAPVLGLALLLLLFWVAHAWGRQAARDDFIGHRDNGFCAFPFVRVVLKDSAGVAKALPNLDQALAEGQYRLLIQSGGFLVLIRTDAPEAEVKPRRPALVVPVGEITLLELTPVLPDCRPG